MLGIFLIIKVLKLFSISLNLLVKEEKLFSFFYNFRFERFFACLDVSYYYTLCEHTSSWYHILLLASRL